MDLPQTENHQLHLEVEILETQQGYITCLHETAVILKNLHLKRM